VFKPILLIGHSEHKLKANDKAINEAVMSREGIKLSEEVGNTFQEDSYLPTKVPEIADLLKKVDDLLKKEVHPLLETFNQWGHILHPKESTMFHSHTRPGKPPGLSWVYYSSVPKNSGELVFTMEACANRVMTAVEPEVGKLVIFPDYIPHFTKKNNSDDGRISISGNAEIPQDKIESMDGMHNLLNYVGIFAG
jgi:hypothetical protein